MTKTLTATLSMALDHCYCWSLLHVLWLWLYLHVLCECIAPMHVFARVWICIKICCCTLLQKLEMQQRSSPASPTAAPARHTPSGLSSLIPAMTVVSFSHASRGPKFLTYPPNNLQKKKLPLFKELLKFISPLWKSSANVFKRWTVALGHFFLLGFNHSVSTVTIKILGSRIYCTFHSPNPTWSYKNH